MLHLPRVMLAAPSSGSGKTMLTCGILQAFCERGLNPASFKCGPDYIDPMFHTKVIGTPSRNLDTFFTDPPVTRHLFAKNAKHAGISVLEGVMGLYDGLGGISVEASSYDLAAVTDTPVILIVNARGMSLSVIPLIQGYLNYQKQLYTAKQRAIPSGRYPGNGQNGRIRGVILNQMTKMTYLLLKEEIERQTGVRMYGYVPRLEDAAVGSRHLGLVTPDEIAGLRERLARLAAELEHCLDLDGIVSLAQEAADYPDEVLALPQSVRRWMPEEQESGVSETKKQEPGVSETKVRKPVVSEIQVQKPKVPWTKFLRIAVARDEAFCFYYQDNLDLLESLGAEIVPFSPLLDETLPEHISGLILGGGYPELYAGWLSRNIPMKNAIREAIQNGMPYLAECGGFMYLHETMEDMEGKTWPMCGCIPGKAYRTSKLGRFGYITLEPGSVIANVGEDRQAMSDRQGNADRQAMSDRQGNADRQAMSDRQENPARCDISEPGRGFLRQGESIRAHEFHYFDSTDPGDAYTAKKPVGKRTWDCVHATDHSAAGYPHLYYWSNPGFAARFLECAGKYSPEKTSRF